MKVFAIGDLHFATTVDKPMDLFGERWQDHMNKIKKQWEKTVSEEDVVIICGDISWGMRLPEAYTDLEIIDQLPGQKICIRGNHDYWWEKIKKLNSLFPTIQFMQNTAYCIGDLAICGTRGWICPKDEPLSEEDQKVYLREGERLKLSLQDGMKKGAKEIVVALHYPPTNEKRHSSLFTEIIQQYPVKEVVYGHLHDEHGWELCMKGMSNQIHYQLVAADYVDFTPVIILETEKGRKDL